MNHDHCQLKVVLCRLMHPHEFGELRTPTSCGVAKAWGSYKFVMSWVQRHILRMNQMLTWEHIKLEIVWVYTIWIYIYIWILCIYIYICIHIYIYMYIYIYMCYRMTLEGWHCPLACRRQFPCWWVWHHVNHIVDSEPNGMLIHAVTSSSHSLLSGVVQLDYLEAQSWATSILSVMTRTSTSRISKLTRTSIVIGFPSALSRVSPSSPTLLAPPIYWLSVLSVVSGTKTATCVNMSCHALALLKWKCHCVPGVLKTCTPTMGTKNSTAFFGWSLLIWHTVKIFCRSLRKTHRSLEHCASGANMIWCDCQCCEKLHNRTITQCHIPKLLKQ